MKSLKSKPALGLIVIAVIMVFMAFLTDIYWFASWIGRPFPRSVPLEEKVAQAFALPDVIGSLLMYASAYGLLRRRVWAIYSTLISLGMSFGSNLFFLSLTGFTFLNILGPSLLFILFTFFYLWIRRTLFFSGEKEENEISHL
ncbi:MAG: hypothetical protein N3B16_06230 [Candidatus Aminicenantes bacterium]|nr:hypothetical protein [Candidatus Aminicenantes bacterium]